MGGNFGNIAGVVAKRLKPARLTMSVVGHAMAEALAGTGLQESERATIRELTQGPTGADWGRVQQILKAIRKRTGEDS